MSVIDRQLVRAVNSGRCFCLVGAGPSCELGMPSWRQLAENILRKACNIQAGELAERGQELLDQCNYPRLFSLVEKTIGQQRLLELVSEQLFGKFPLGRVYQYITAWPFQSYLTTNFDDQLNHHLEAVGRTFVTHRNKQDDLRVLHSATKNVVFKIHGDTSVPDDIVLTAEQYDDFKRSARRQYWRDSILSLLKMVDLVIIGYNASDPDFESQLERVKEIASPDHPVFMFATGLELKQVRDYYAKYNIRIISYNNEDGGHRDLRRVLARYAPFIAKRGGPFVGLQPIDTNTASLASSIYLFTQLRVAENEHSCIQRACAALVLQILSDSFHGQEASVHDLANILARKTYSVVGIDPMAVHSALEYLHQLGLISFSDGAQTVILEPKGKGQLSKVEAERILLQQRFENACRLYIKRDYLHLSDSVANSVIEQLRKGIVQAFEKRGMEIARFVFSDDPMDISDATDILDTINEVSKNLLSDNERSVFADLMLEVMLKPDDEMKGYLAALCHGYFAYHALGLEPRCSDERLNVARQTAWLLDSSIILPLLAVDCLNHDYAKDLLQRIKSLGLHCYTTERLFAEVREHARWAITNFANATYDSANLLQAAMAGPGYKQNLFLDGFIKWSATQGRPSMDQYMIQCLGKGYSADLHDALRHQVLTLGIEIRDFVSWPNFSQAAWAERDSISEEIAGIRRGYGTYTGTGQCDAEAEVVLICSREKAIFISQSSILNKMSKAQTKITWKPEAMYRFLTLFSSVPPATDLLYQCMTQDFFYTGFDIVDNKAISHYAAPMIRQARMVLEQERTTYEKALGKVRLKELEVAFEQIPDVEKPFYSMQFLAYVARQETKQREAAEERARSAEAAKGLSEKERDEYERLKSKKEAKKRKRLQRERRATSLGKQAKHKGKAHHH